MRGFFIFLCIAFTQAEKLGYNYSTGRSHNAFEGRFRHRGSTISSSANTDGAGTRADSGFSRYSANTISSANSETVGEKLGFNYASSGSISTSAKTNGAGSRAESGFSRYPANTVSSGNSETVGEKLGFNYASMGSSINALESGFEQRENTLSSSASDIGNGGYSGDTFSSRSIEPEAETEYNKQFFSYTAPEEEFNDIEGAQRLASSMRKNLRVVFIKTPENKGLANAALQLAKHNAESKTAIYVLTKQSDVNDLANKLQNIQHSQEAKPEVHFVKYRTPEEALRAQQIIQHEYDAFGGPSRFSNEGVAPVLDFSSKKEEVTNSNIVSVDSLGHLSSSAYLPPKSRH